MLYNYRREVLTKYEVLAIAAAKTKQKVKAAHIEEKMVKFIGLSFLIQKKRDMIFLQELLEV